MMLAYRRQFKSQLNALRDVAILIELSLCFSVRLYFQAELSCDGLILGDSSVLAPSYLCLKICFDGGSSDGWDKLLPGTWIKFTAWSPPGMPAFKIKTWSPNSSPLLVPVHAIPTREGFAVRSCIFCFLISIFGDCLEFIFILYQSNSFACEDPVLIPANFFAGRLGKSYYLY